MTARKRTNRPIVEEGRFGLFYQTYPDVPGVLVAGETAAEAESRGREALSAIRFGTSPPDGHWLLQHEAGFLCTLPIPGWMTPDQRVETIERVHEHLRTRLLS